MCITLEDDKYNKNRGCSSLASDRDLVQFFFFFPSSRRCSPGSYREHCRKVHCLNLLLLKAKYSSEKNSQVVAFMDCWTGDLLPEIF